MKLWNPISFFMIQSSIAVPSAPLWLMNPMLPLFGSAAAKLRSRGAHVFMAPRQLGPCILMPCFLAMPGDLSLELGALLARSP